MVTVLRWAAFYHLAWGGLTVAFPGAPFRWLGVEALDPAILQSQGLFMACFGVGFAIASFAPLRHWPIVFLATLSKILGPIWFLWAAFNGSVLWAAGVTIPFDDLIWLPPFVLISTTAYREHVAELDEPNPLPRDRAILKHMSQRGYSLAELSLIRPTLTIFLRHAGCTFCREALADLKKLRPALEKRNVGLAFAHMTPEPGAEAFFRHYGMEDVDRFGDPNCELYRAFGLRRGGLATMFGPGVWGRGFRAGILDGHGVGGPVGDTLRMPGMFLIDNGMLLRSHTHEGPEERPDYLDFVDGARLRNHL